MNTLPPPLGAGDLFLWRLDRREHAATWHMGEGAYRVGGRWNSKGVRAIYASVDPATAILEVAVHKTFVALDTTPHVLTRAKIVDPARIQIVQPEDVPNPNWLHPGLPSAGQQAFGDSLLAAHPMILIPSVVSTHSWNLIFAPSAGLHEPAEHEAFALDPRLHPPA